MGTVSITVSFTGPLRTLLGRGHESLEVAEGTTVADDKLNDNTGDSAICARLRAALRQARRRVKKLEVENSALREELLSAGEMIETLAMDLEKPVREL